MKCSVLMKLTVLAMCLVGLTNMSQAQVWNLNADGNWNVASNWNPSGVPGAGSTPTFGNVITANRIVTLDVNSALLAGLNFNNTNGLTYTLNRTGANVLNFDSGAQISFSSTLGSTITAPITSSATGALSINFNTFSANSIGTTLLPGQITANNQLNINYALTAVHTINSPITANAAINFTGKTFGNQVVAGIISNGTTPGSIIVNTTTLHADSGSVQLGGANTFSGGVRINSGVLRVLSDAGLGTGTLTAAGGILQTGGTAALVLPNNINVDNSDLIFATTASATTTLSGVISGTNGVRYASRGGQTLFLSGVNTYGGQTVTTLSPVDAVNSANNAGVINLTGSALSSSRFIATAGGTIHLNNSGVADAIPRIAPAVPVDLNNGIFQITGGSGTGLPFAQQAGALNGSGYNVVVVGSQAVTAQGVQLDFTNLSRGAAGTGTFLFAASSENFGTATPGINQQQVIFRTTALTLTGAGTAGQPNIGIIPYAIGGTAGLGSTGTGLVTYGANGVRLLDPATEYSVNSLVAGNNVRLTSAFSGSVTGTTSVNSLFFDGLGSLGGSGTINVASGTLFAANSPTIGSNITINFGSTTGLIFSGSGTTNIDGRITGTNGFIKSGGSSGNNNSTGAGSLKLAPYNTYTGVTIVNDGLIVINDNSALGQDTSAIVLNSRGLSNGSGLRVDTTTNGQGLVVRLSRNINTNNGYSSIGAATVPASNPRSVLIASGDINGDGGILIAGNSALLTRGMTFLTGTNTFNGAMRHFAGDLGIATDTSLGNGSFDLGANTGAGVVQFGSITRNKLVNVSANSQWDTNGYNFTLNGTDGQITGSPGVFTKAGAGDFTLDLAGPSSFNPTNFNINAGRLVLTGSTVLSSTRPRILGGTLLLDGTTTPLDNRLNAANNVFFANAGSGTFQINTNNGNIVQNLTGISHDPSGSSYSRIVMNVSSGGSGTVLVNATGTTGYTVSNNSVFFLEGTGLNNSSSASSPGTTGLRFLTAPTEANSQMSGTGATGTNTVGILRGGIGRRTGASAAYGFLTQTSTAAGVRLLDTNEYATNTLTTNANTLINATSTLGTGTINSLFVTGGSTLNISSASPLTIRSGTILSTGGNNIIQGTGTNGGGAFLGTATIGTAASGYVFYVEGGTELTVRTGYTGTGSQRFMKTGPGTLIYDPRNAAGGIFTPSGSGIQDVRILEGTLRIPAGQSLASVPGNQFLAGGATIQNQGVNIPATSRTFFFNGEGGVFDLGTSWWQLTASTNPALAVGIAGTPFNPIAGNGGSLTLASGTLILGSGSSGTPAAVQPNTIEGGIIVNSGSTLVLNADSSFATSSILGTGTLQLNGGRLAPKFKDRDIIVPVAVNTTTQRFVNQDQVPEGAADATASGIRFLAPVRIMQPTIFRNDMTGGNLTFIGSIYDDPITSGFQVTYSTTSGGTQGDTILQGAAAYRGGTVIENTNVRVVNTIGSATGTGNVNVAFSNGERGFLRGDGFIVPANNGTLSVNGTLSPGNRASTGILTVGAPDRKVTVEFVGSNSHYDFYLSNVAAVSAGPNTGGSTNGGTNNSFLRVLGDGTSELNFNPSRFNIFGPGFNESLSYSWVVATVPTTPTAQGTINFTLPLIDTSGYTGNASNGTFSLTNVSGTIYLNFTPVPEPTTLFAVSALLVGAVGYTRRRRSQPS
ncbi:MAG: beta strand repeat-containing protein [Fimbriiglobus sp.]